MGLRRCEKAEVPRTVDSWVDVASLRAAEATEEVLNALLADLDHRLVGGSAGEEDMDGGARMDLAHIHIASVAARSVHTETCKCTHWEAAGVELCEAANLATIDHAAAYAAADQC
jgi:hypothetical protein